MDGGPEGQAKGNERRQRQPRRHETHCRRLAKEHDEAARSVQQRRAGGRFRYRRRRQTAPYLRLAQDAPFHVIFFAALWTTLVGAGALATIGTIALGNDTESYRISVRTAVDAESPCSRVPSNSSFSTYRLHSATLLDLITTTTSSRRAHATFCSPRLWPTFAHANLQPQRSCLDSCIYTPSLLVTRPSLPTALQLQSAPPIASSRPHARPHRADSGSVPASPRPAAPPTRRPNCPGRLARTRPSLCRAVQSLCAAVGLHGLPWSTLQYPTEIEQRKKRKKKHPILICNVSHTNAAGCLNVHSTHLCPGRRTRLTYAILPLQVHVTHCRHSPLRAGMASSDDVFAQSRWKARRTGEAVSMTWTLLNRERLSHRQRHLRQRRLQLPRRQPGSGGAPFRHWEMTQRVRSSRRPLPKP